MKMRPSTLPRKNSGTSSIRMTTLVMIAWLLGGCCPKTATETIITEKRDTLYIAGDTVRIASEARIDTSDEFALADSLSRLFEHRSDLAERKPFTALLDTTVDAIRVFIRYRYPANWWSVNVATSDSDYVTTRFDTSGERIVWKPEPYVPMWCYAVLGLCGALAALAIYGRIR